MKTDQDFHIQILRKGGEGFGRVFGLHILVKAKCGKHELLEGCVFNRECLPMENMIFEQGIDERGGTERVDLEKIFKNFGDGTCPICENKEVRVGAI